ncbi:MAG TPA: GrpB family protein, partial [Candidatus Acidoferrales bacterium]|nr:GrpB family protein [Candidatus Acidoferrales bacterium]
GSTAVPGLAAKPVIDIQVSVAALEPMDPYRQPLRSIGYAHMPHPDDSFCPFFHRPREWPHNHHVHVVRAGDAEERRTLAFRDYLREHPETARAYAQLKLRLAAQFSVATQGSRQAYADAKTEFIEQVIAAAFKEGYPRSRGDRAGM